MTAKPVMVTARKPRFGRAEDLTTDGANRRAYLADAMMQAFKRRIAATAGDVMETHHGL